MRQLFLAGAALLMATTAQAQSTRVRSTSGAEAIAISGGGGGGGTQTIRTAPSVVAPSVYGANPCSNSASGGSSWIPFGVSFGAQWTERECRDQEWFRFFQMAGEPGVAWAHICANVPRMHEAMRLSGRQCPNDPTERPAVAVAAPPAPVRSRCALTGATLSPSEIRRQVRECRG